jgi:hypothetical protein
LRVLLLRVVVFSIFRRRVDIVAVVILLFRPTCEPTEPSRKPLFPEGEEVLEDNKTPKGARDSAQNFRRGIFDRWRRPHPFR